ncbi:MAG: tripartite tricarboxylate transporter substrate-binding protein, partial [Rubrivivax sp.]|nr:tripartite tricarboxylate transporter substrate-binding protein [Rubrivivax sp.]
MNLNRRQSLLLAAAGAALPWRAQAQGFEQPKFLYGFPAGSAGDIACRRVAERVGGTAYAKNAAIVENRPGAGGRIALDGLRAAPTDGSVLAMTPFSCVSIYPHVYKKLSYDPVADFMPVSIAAIMHHGLAVGPVVPDSVKDVKGFVAWAKANPDKANYGSPAAGSTPHFLGALLGLSQNAEMKHIPYRGSVPGITDVVGGQLAAMFTPAGDFLPNHRAGKLRLLGTSGKTRLPFAPDVATFAEQGFGELTTEEWFGFYAPARTPAAVVAAANAAINQGLKDKSLVDGLG